jgi:hypothetical protein
LAAEAALPRGALAEIDLASDTAWTLSADGGPGRPIKVPRGGWNSDWQELRIDTMAGVKDYVVYERKILVPKIAAGQVTKISFGAVNYGADALGIDRDFRKTLAAKRDKLPGPKIGKWGQLQEWMVELTMKPGDATRLSCDVSRQWSKPRK